MIATIDTFESCTDATDCSCVYCFLDELCIELVDEIVEALLCAPFHVTDSFAN